MVHYADGPLLGIPLPRCEMKSAEFGNLPITNSPVAYAARIAHPGRHTRPRSPPTQVPQVPAAGIVPSVY